MPLRKYAFSVTVGLAFFLFLFPVCSPTEPQPDPGQTCPPPNCPQCESVSITRPDSATVWRRSDFPDTIQWQGACCESSDSIRMFLYRDGRLIDFFPPLVPNTNTLATTDLVPAEWEEGTGYRIQILDKSGGQGWSAPFQIRPDSLATIVVTRPTSATVWKHGEMSSEVAFSIDAHGANDSVRVEIYQGRALVGQISDWVRSTMVVPTVMVPSSWGHGIGFRVRVVDRTGKFGWSAPFTVKAGAKDIITVGVPGTGTVWQHGQQWVPITWEESFGDSARLELHRSGSYVDTLSPWIADSGTYVRKGIVRPSWVPDSTYQVMVRSRTGIIGYSSRFRIVNDTMASLKVTRPTAPTDWYAATRGDTVAWQNSKGDSAVVYLYMADTLVGAWSGPVPASGPAIRDSIMPEKWGFGSNCRVKVVDNLGRYGWSDPFEIRKDTSASITVTYPDSATAWMHGQPNLRVQWSGSAGGEVRVELFSEGRQKGMLVDLVVAESTTVRSQPLDPDWQPGFYRIKVTDSLDNFGWSDSFRIIADTLRTLAIDLPVSVLYHGQSGIGANVRSTASDSVRAFMYRDNTKLGLFADWSTDTVLLRSIPIPTGWGTGQGFYLRVEDNQGRYGLSTKFSIVADSAQLLVVVQPFAGTVWLHGDSVAQVMWTGPETPDTTESVRVDVYKGDSYVDLFSLCPLDSTRTCARSEPIPAAWGSGGDFRLKVTLVKAGLFGWSDSVRISE